jgi:hypothetical protein
LTLLEQREVMAFQVHLSALEVLKMPGKFARAESGELNKVANQVGLVEDPKATARSLHSRAEPPRTEARAW